MKKNTSQFDIIIIGGGASGLMAAIQAARHHADVLVLEHQSRPAVKILSTGNGRCNLTNSDMAPDHFRCADPLFPVPALNAFSAADTIAFFQEELYVSCRDKNGYWYPRTNQAVTVRDALLSCCQRYNVRILTDIRISSIEKEKEQFHIQTDHGRYLSAACILCCGGKAFPKSGSDGSGYLLAKRFGHSIIKPLPALTALYTDRDGLSALAGVRTDASVSLYVDQDLLASDHGELQFTDYGISGIPVFQVSRFAAVAMHIKRQVTAVIDLVPEMREEELKQYLADAGNHQNIPVAELLNGILPKKIVTFLLKETDPDQDTFLWDITYLIKHLDVPVVKTASFSQAQTTTGGVRISEIDPESMGSLLEQGLYFAGEIMDVDGACGGYNLQWAWASGSLAGISAAEYVKGKEL